MNQFKNETVHVLCLAIAVLLVTACGDATEAEGTVSGLRTDVNGQYSFEVEVRHGEAVPASEARWVLENMTIVPFAEAFAGAERPPVGRLLDEAAPLDADAIQVTLRPLDADVAPGDFAWRVPLRPRAETAELAEPMDGVGKKESALILPGTPLAPYGQVYDTRYRCLVYTVSSAFCPTSPTVCGFFGCYSDYGNVCVDQGKLGKAGTTCRRSYCTPASMAKSRGWTRAYWRARIKAGKSGGVVASHLITCI